MSGRLKRCWIRRGRPATSRKRARRTLALRQLFTEPLERRILLATVTSVNPLENSLTAPVSTNVSATYDEVINPATATTANFVVSSRQGGLLGSADATVSATGTTITLDPTSDFFAGDRVQVTSTAGIQGTSAGVSRVWEFRTAAGGGLGVFEDSGQRLGVAANNTRSFSLALGDLDSDGDMDIFVANDTQGSRVYLNSGSAEFTDSGQSLGSTASRDVALGDLDGDGDLDAVVANTSGQANRVWQNNGSAVFTEVQSLGSISSQDVKLGDLDGDGDLDVFFANSGGNRVWLNSGGVLTDSNQSLGNHTSLGVDLGDVDGDGDLDAFVGNTLGQNDRVWINNGSGVFSDSGQALFDNLTAKSSREVLMGDVDGDGDLDTFVVGRSYNNRLFLNDGTGVFTDSGQVIDAPINPFFEYGGAMGDVDADGDLDIVTSGEAIAHWNRLFLNDGSGIFTETGQVIGGQTYGVDTMGTFGIELGDLDGDGDLDVAFANDNTFPNINSTTRVWLNRNPVTTVTLSIDNTSIDEAAGAATVSATLSGPSTQMVTVNLGITGTATATDDYVASDTQIVVAPGATSGSITITAVQDALDEADETVVVDIASITGAGGSGQVITTITDDDPTPTVTLALDSATIAEDAGAATFTATLSAASGRDVTIDLEITGTATETDDYTLSGTQIVIPAGSTSGSVTVTAIQDNVDEPDETMIVDISAITGADEDGTQQQTATIIDDDAAPLVTLAVDNASIPEDGGVATFSATLTGLSVNPVTIDLAISGTATQNSDYTLSGTQIVVAPGASSGSVTVTSIPDIIITEGGETVVVDIANVTNGNEDGTQQATTTIIDDVMGPDVTMSVDSTTLAEAAGSAALTVTLASVFSLDVTVELSFSGTATVNDDYKVSGTEIVVPAGSTTGTVTVTAVQDALIEGDETVVVDIAAVINGGESGNQQQNLTIVDDETPPTVVVSVDSSAITEDAGTATFTVTLSAASTLDVTVDLGITGTATPTADFTISATQIVVPAGSTARTFTVTAVQDTIDDDDETVIVDIIGVTNASESGTQQQTVTIVDDDEAPPLPPGPTPAANSHVAPRSTVVGYTFDQTVTAATATDRTFVVHSTQRGQLIGGATAVSADGPSIMHDPTNDFFPGELVQVTVTSEVMTAGGAAAPRVFEFRAAAGGSAQFTESGQTLGIPTANTASWDVVLGDVDADGDLDAFMANWRYNLYNPGGVGDANRVYLNDGSGVFTDSGQTLGNNNSRHPAMGDIDGDGDLDVVVPNDAGQGDRVWRNDGNGVFSEAQVFGNTNSEQVELADVDGDGDLDVFVAVSNGANRVWLNNGSGTLADSGQMLGNHTTDRVEMGDFDNDGDLDAFTVNFYQSDRVWLNDGNGVFVDSGQQLIGQRSGALAVGDIDGDGDLDVFVGNVDYEDQVFINDGNGVFADSGQRLQPSYTTYGRRDQDIEFGDLDGDGDLDAFIVHNTFQAHRVWANDGNGIFTDLTGQTLDIDTNSLGVALGDVNGDGSLDAFVANDTNANNALSVNRVWFNQVLTPSVTLSVDNTAIPEAAGVATFTATLSATFGQPVTIDLGVSGTATATDDYTLSGTQIVIPAGSTSGSVTVTAVQDTADEPDETVIVSIMSITNGQGSGQLTTTIVDDDEPPVPDVTLSVDNASIPEAAGVATFTANLSEPTSVPVTIALGITGTATATTDYTVSGTQIVVPAGSTSASVTVTAVQDALEEPDETVIVDIADVTGGNESGSQQQTTTITDDDAPATPRVSSFTGTSSGFVAVFNSELDTSTLNLYDTQSAGQGVADATLVGATTGPVAGSLVVDAASRSVTFIKTGDPLAADTYTVTLRSADDGFRTASGTLLDGNTDGTPGGDFSDTFTIAAPDANAVMLSLPDFVRGPGQDVNVPADAPAGIPLSISEGTGVRSGVIEIKYNPALLNITGATVGAAMPTGATVTLATPTAGTAMVTFTSPTDLPAGSNTLVNLETTVPSTNASEIYGSQQVVDISSAALTTGLGTELPVIDNDALHLASYFADVSGNGRINASDASQVARFAALLESGYAGSLLTDPVVMGDISGNGRINAADASLVARFAALLVVPEIPPIPGGIALAGLVGSVSPHPLPAFLSVASPVPIMIPSSPHPAVGDASPDRPGPGVLDDFASPIPYPAVDVAMADLGEAADNSDEDELPQALEDALNELLSQ